MSAARTLFAKLWDEHRIAALDDGTDLIHIDRIALHERAGAPALRTLAQQGRAIFDPSSVFGTMDHVVDTRPGRTDETLVPGGRESITVFRDECRKSQLKLFDLADPRQGIVHVTMPQQGVALPGLTMICADSHTGTMGGVGALAWGVGISDILHALATQTLALVRPRAMRVWIDGELDHPVSAKDVVLHVIKTAGLTSAVGHSVEFAGPAVEALGIEGRMTLCNMGVEFGAWSSIVAPDQKSFEYLYGTRYAPDGEGWRTAVDRWRLLHSDEGAVFDTEVRIDVSGLAPMLSWGTNPSQVVPVDGTVPDPDSMADASTRQASSNALLYMGLEPGQLIEDIPIDAVFIGSCTNARISDLREAAKLLRGRVISPKIATAIVVPGSVSVKQQAEIEGLDQVFRNAGFEWREPGCSLCFHAGGEGFPAGARVASTTNRNFENRQGSGIRTHIMSPATAAASALHGRFADPRKLIS